MHGLQRKWSPGSVASSRLADLFRDAKTANREPNVFYFRARMHLCVCVSILYWVSVCVDSLMGYLNILVKSVCVCYTYNVGGLFFLSSLK